MQTAIMCYSWLKSVVNYAKWDGTHGLALSFEIVEKLTFELVLWNKGYFLTLSASSVRQLIKRVACRSRQTSKFKRTPYRR